MLRQIIIVCSFLFFNHWISRYGLFISFLSSEHRIATVSPEEKQDGKTTVDTAVIILALGFTLALLACGVLFFQYRRYKKKFLSLQNMAPADTPLKPADV